MRSDEIAAWTGGQHHGEVVTLEGVASLDVAGPGQLAYAERKVSGEAGCILVSKPVEGRTCVVVPDPKLAFIQVLNRLHPRSLTPGVHPTAVVDGTLGEDCQVGPHAVIEAGATLGDRVVVGPGSVVRAGATIGDDTVLHARVVLYAGVTVGRRCELHAGAVIGADGFSYHPSERGPVKVPQVGTVVLEDDVEIGANSCVDRAFLEETRVGAGSATDNLVQIGHNCSVGRFNMIAAQAGLSGSCSTGTGVLIGGQVGFADHTRVGDGVRIGAQSGVHGRLKDGTTVLGTPARPVREMQRIWAAMKWLPELVRKS